MVQLTRFAILLSFVSLTAPAYTERCPFCSTVNNTLSEQLKLNDLVVIGTLTGDPEIPGEVGEPPKRRFEVKRIFKGENFISTGNSFTTGLVGKHATGSDFLVWGIGPPIIAWDKAIASHERIERYLQDIQALPEKSAQRLIFFQDYFEDPLSLLATDAYDEFAIASYADLIAIKDHMPRERLLDFLRNPEIEENRRRLYYTMVGICGSKEDLPFLEELIARGPVADNKGLDALVACYLCLKGGDGLPLIEKTFLTAKDVEFAKVHQVIVALRFHGTEVSIVDREQLLNTMRKLLQQPKLADIVIPDLARWEDWSVLDQLVSMFKESTSSSSWIRVPIFKYLSVCPLPAAKEHLDELKRLDQAAYQRAVFLSNLKPDTTADNEPENTADNTADTTDESESEIRSR